MLKNINQLNVQYNCHHEHRLQCKFQLRCPVVINGDGKNKLNMSKSWLTNQHSKECSAKTGIPLLQVDRDDDETLMTSRCLLLLLCTRTSRRR
jgi:hypothetical protein